MSVNTLQPDQETNTATASVDALMDNLNGDNSTDSAADDLLMAGYQAAKGDSAAVDELEDKDSSGAAVAAPEPNADELFRKEMHDRFAVLEKSTASANGLAGHLKQQLTKLSQGKTITKESLKRVSEEFGEEFAEAFAADLQDVGLGGGQALSDDRVDELLQSRLGEVKEDLERKFEFKLVTKTHKDAPDYFAGGQHNAAFVGWVQTLPPERQQEIGSSWDSDTVTSYLDEFKAQRDKAATQAARQKSRVERAVTPTTGAAAAAVQPLEDPLMAGWNKAKGLNRSGARG